MEQICRRCGTVLPEGSLFCPECGCQVSGQPEMAPVWQEPGLVRPPLKWFKFIIYVQLFLSALGNLVAGIQLLTRLAYGGLWASIYTFYPALRPVDAVMGVLSLGLMVLALVVRQKLAKFRRGAPKLYLIWLGISVGVALFDLVAASLVLGQLVLTGWDVVSLLGNLVLIILNRLVAFSPALGQLVLTGLGVGSLLGNVVLILLNRVYFRKREHLFVN